MGDTSRRRCLMEKFQELLCQIDDNPCYWDESQLERTTESVATPLAPCEPCGPCAPCSPYQQGPQGPSYQQQGSLPQVPKEPPPLITHTMVEEIRPTANERREKKLEVKGVKSRELHAGYLISTCICDRKNGLQHECQRSDCGVPPCFTRPYPDCIPSGGTGLRSPSPRRKGYHYVQPEVHNTFEYQRPPFGPDGNHPAGMDCPDCHPPRGSAASGDTKPVYPPLPFCRYPPDPPILPPTLLPCPSCDNKPKFDMNLPKRPTYECPPGHPILPKYACPQPGQSQNQQNQCAPACPGYSAGGNGKRNGLRNGNGKGNGNRPTAAPLSYQEKYKSHELRAGVLLTGSSLDATA